MMQKLQVTVVSVITLGCILMLRATAAEHGAGLIGKPAQEWAVTNWFNSTPLSLDRLRGQVVLVRWWTAPGCRFCAATAPALNEFHQEYAERGLKVVGFYHHKDDAPLDLAEVKRQAHRFGFQFPVAVDSEWRTLKQWWLERSERNWTSVSFLIDRRGIIRHVHPGGEYVKGDADYAAMKAKIEELLKEK